MPRAQGLAIIFSRCNRAAETEAWNRWHREHYFQDLAGHGGPWFASHWQLTPPPAPGRPSPGFTHVTLFEFEGPDPDAQWGALLARHEALESAHALHPHHCLIGVDTFRTHGRWSEKPEPDTALTGHILAYVLCNDSARQSEWDQWYEDTHAVDMMSSQAFSALSRWRRDPPTRFGPRHLTLYDVSGIPLSEAVERSAAVMPEIHSGGRWLPCHAGGMAISLEAGPDGPCLRRG